MIFVLFLAQWKITREYAIAKYYNLIAYVLNFVSPRN